MARWLFYTAQTVIFPCKLLYVDAEGRLPILKALGDNTRYAIYLELARSATPLTSSDIADTLGLHANTVRPHLERMRDVGLVEYETHAEGVGRPQHCYHLAPKAPSLGLEPPTFPLLAKMLVQTSAAAGASGGDAVEVGREQGRIDAEPVAAEACLDALIDRLDALGFDPAAVDDGDTATVAFTHCPFGELAAAFPELVCSLHQGMVEGFVEAASGDDLEVKAFRTLVDRTPCQVELTRR